MALPARADCSFHDANGEYPRVIEDVGSTPAVTLGSQEPALLTQLTTIRAVQLLDETRVTATRSLRVPDQIDLRGACRDEHPLHEGGELLGALLHRGQPTDRRLARSEALGQGNTQNQLSASRGPIVSSRRTGRGTARAR